MSVLLDVIAAGCSEMVQIIPETKRKIELGAETDNGYSYHD
jgi:hypothetical protein